MVEYPSMQLAFFASHNGSNVQAIVEQIKKKELNASAKVIISNNSDAPVLHFAREVGIPSVCINQKNTENVDQTTLAVLQSYQINWIILGGYLKKIGDGIIEAYENRILNIHPSLLPKYGGAGMYGKKVHQAVLDSGDRTSGATIHAITSEYDAGKIVAQYTVPVYQRDTVETLAERVLQIEHLLYPQTLKDIQRGIIEWD